MYMYTVYMYMIFFNLHHLGTQFFLGNVDTVLDLKIRQLHSPKFWVQKSGVSDVEPDFFHCIKVRKTGVCGP